MYVRYALAGALCCALTHGAVVPVDVVKTRMQLERGVYTRGLLATAAHLVKEEGAPWARVRARTELPQNCLAKVMSANLAGCRCAPGRESLSPHEPGARWGFASGAGQAHGARLHTATTPVPHCAS
jgi:hypothetical protein